MHGLRLQRVLRRGEHRLVNCSLKMQPACYLQQDAQIIVIVSDMGVRALISPRQTRS